jgi:hypothetical protein
MTTVIVGDSWGCGEWNLECTQVLHPGLEFYLKNDGHTVINLSQGGISNLDIVTRLQHYFLRFPDLPRGPIFVFQTEYTRDYKHAAREKDYGSTDIDDQGLVALSDKWIGRFYQQLSEFAQYWNRDIKIIGGCSDTLWFDNMQQDYPGCEIVCQSLTNLILDNHSQIREPVYSWYTNSTVELLEEVKSNLVNTQQLEEITKLISQGFTRESLLRENPYFFYPDGRHPNRIGHEILYRYIIEKELL